MGVRKFHAGWRYLSVRAGSASLVAGRGVQFARPREFLRLGFGACTLAGSLPGTIWGIFESVRTRPVILDGTLEPATQEPSLEPEIKRTRTKRKSRG